MGQRNPATEESACWRTRRLPDAQRSPAWQLIESENRYTALQEDIAAGPARRRDAQVDWLPAAPARYTLTSHRAPITRVAFHPTFSLLASASEDTTVKIWDWETGSFERTLKGHTREVWGVDFDSKGSFLGA